MTVKTFIVKGMACKNCKGHIERAIKSVTGVKEVIVDMENGEVKVSGEEFDQEQVKQSVEMAGYDFKGETINRANNSDIWLS